MSFLSVLVLVGVSIFGMRCYAAAPNILFIVSDDHGWGDLPSNWDDTEVHLPTLDALARSGVRFPITTLFRFVVLLGHACLPDSTQLKTACGVAP